MKKKVLKRLLSIILGATLIGGMVGCGNINGQEVKTSEVAQVTEVAQTSEVSSEVSEEAVEPRTLRITWWGSQSRADSTAKVLELFEETHPGVTVEMEFADSANYWNKLTTQAVSGTLPDVIQMNANNFRNYVQNGILADLSSYVEAGTLDLSGAPENLLATGELNGGTYGIPTGSNAPIFVYRQDVLDECGLTMPEKLTWSKLMEMSEIVYEKTGRKNHLVGLISSEMLGFVLATKGLTMYNEEATALGFDDPSILVDFWENGLTGIEKGYGHGVGEVTAAEPFVEEVWCGYISSNTLASREEASGCRLEVAELPWVDGSDIAPGFLKPTMYWSVAETSEVKDLAVEFIDFFVNELEVYDIVGIDRGVPLRVDVQEDLASQLEGSEQRVMNIMSYLSQDGKTSPYVMPNTTAAAEVQDTLSQLTERVYYGAVTDLEQAAKEWMEQTNALLAKAAANN